MTERQLQQNRFHILKRPLNKLKSILPALFFFGGFIWDAWTLGRHLAPSDLYILSGYLFLAALILLVMDSPSYTLADSVRTLEKYAERCLPSWLSQPLVRGYRRVYYPHLLYFLLQFLFGNLLSALFILYFKSSSHGLAWGMSFLLAALLIANEYLEDKYQQVTLSWAMFGFCAILLFNFALPFLMGSISAFWFYLSTLLGAGLTYALYIQSTDYEGSIKPVGVIAILLMLAYAMDMIPPVPLVKREIVMAFDLKKINNQYQLTEQAANWWVFWRKNTDDLTISPGQRIYCFSAIFAPAGLKTKLFHRWEYYDKKASWQTSSRIGFSLNGGRNGGYRGYTYKSNLATGNWRVSVETENGKTIATQEFSIRTTSEPVSQFLQIY